MDKNDNDLGQAAIKALLVNDIFTHADACRRRLADMMEMQKAMHGDPRPGLSDQEYKAVEQTFVRMGGKVDQMVVEFEEIIKRYYDHTAKAFKPGSPIGKT